jgi:hypothetical protein
LTSPSNHLVELRFKSTMNLPIDSIYLSEAFKVS